jgi:hypothetical protein
MNGSFITNQNGKFLSEIIKNIPILQKEAK